MRTFLILWLTPLALLGGWYGLSSNDISLGTTIFSRATHDQVFGIYANILNVEPEVLPGMLARTIIFDCFLVGLIIAYRKRAIILPWFKQRVLQRPA
ncbi:MAG: DUF6105 family protein [Pseudomonadota bacterium]